MIVDYRLIMQRVKPTMTGDAKLLNLVEQNRARGTGSRNSRAWMSDETTTTTTKERKRDTKKKKKNEREYVESSEKGANATSNDSSEQRRRVD